MTNDKNQVEQTPEEPSAPIKRINQVKEIAAAQKNRAKILVYAAAIESDLTELFARLFAGSGGIKDDRLLDSQKPSSLDFATKIELAYRLGLISHRLMCHLNIVRDFRNECAHLETDFDFLTADHRSRINGAFLEMKDNIQKVFQPKKGTEFEDKFETVCTLAILLLQNSIEQEAKKLEKSTETIYK